ncbi:Conserved hypothetical membrane spanning protein [Bifidobacterium dentium Bd1]|uniref:Conserved hypothetical membrane spanning protein n=1 Tax=Bifidobacterium dentium (strain ATCC 27534 / DSM 20436 / JCM 1195 / Bd1) TaxID=401473 RepID=D2Q7J7_BIFDB|nr:Conserved hypothetical membrane spanning protein [Bifidobacterium dentium Bd1]
MRGLSDAVDAMWINILMIVTSIPIITIGAALAAGHDTARKSLAGEGTVTRNYFAAFRSNFIKTTGYWLIFGVTGAVSVYSWIVLQITPLLIPKFALSIVWIIGFEWIWALQARFENSFWRTLGNAFVFGVSNIGHTLALAAIDAVFVALLAGKLVLHATGPVSAADPRLWHHDHVAYPDPRAHIQALRPLPHSITIVARSS